MVTRSEWVRGAAAAAQHCQGQNNRPHYTSTHTIRPRHGGGQDRTARHTTRSGHQCWTGQDRTGQWTGQPATHHTVRPSVLDRTVQDSGQDSPPHTTRPGHQCWTEQGSGHWTLDRTGQSTATHHTVRPSVLDRTGQWTVDRTVRHTPHGPAISAGQNRAVDTGHWTGQDSPPPHTTRSGHQCWTGQDSGQWTGQSATHHTARPSVLDRTGQWTLDTGQDRTVHRHTPHGPAISAGQNRAVDTGQDSPPYTTRLDHQCLSAGYHRQRRCPAVIEATNHRLWIICAVTVGSDAGWSYHGRQTTDCLSETGLDHGGRTDAQTAAAQNCTQLQRGTAAPTGIRAYQIRGGGERRGHWPSACSRTDRCSTAERHKASRSLHGPRSHGTEKC